MRRRSAMSSAAALFLAVSLPLSVVHGQEVGMFFDENAEVCVRDIENFGPALKIYVFAFAEPELTLNGAFIRLALPVGFQVRNQEGPPDAQNTIAGDIASPLGIDITLSPCKPAGAPVLLMTFELSHFDSQNPDAHVEDLLLKLRGGTIVADDLTLTEPNLKICDPDDPLEGQFELAEAVALQATLNCTSECPCTVAIAAGTWADFKRLYLEP